MLTITMPAAATHNSAGGGISIAEAKQINDDGTITPDIPENGWVDEHTHQYEVGLTNAYGGNLSEDLPARDGPMDQSGDNYIPDRGDCEPFSSPAFQDEPDPVLAYENALPNWANPKYFDGEFEEASGDDDFYADRDLPGGVIAPSDATIEEARSDACYVGLLDTQTQYQHGWQRPVVEIISDEADPNDNVLPTDDGGGIYEDPLYPVNPDPGDDCNRVETGLGIAKDTVPGPAEEALGEHDESQECTADGHQAHYWSGSGSYAISTDLVDIAIGGHESEDTVPDLIQHFDAEDRDWYGSGTVTIPMSYTAHFFLLGYPHPANPDPSPISAASDIWDLPFHGVPEEACGQMGDQDNARTPPGNECQLLDPVDLTLYDNDPDGYAELVDLPAEDRGRLCEMRPDFQTLAAFNPADVSCGPFEDQAPVFVPFDDAGGVLVDEEGTPQVAPTYLNTLPGWKSARATVTQAGTLVPLDAVDALVFNETSFAQTAYDRYVVSVNPHVPTLDEEAWCIAPQMLTDGATIGGFDGWEAWVEERIDEINDPDADHGYDSVDDFFATEFDTVDHFGGGVDGDATGENALANLSAPGVYGPYQAAAVDIDMRGSGLTAVHYGGVYEGHGIPGWNGWGEEVSPLIDDLFEAANDVIDETEDPSDEAQDLLEDTPVDEEAVQELLDEVDDSVEDVETLAQAISDAVSEVQDRTSPTASSDPDPVRLPGDHNYEDFSRDLDPGLGCDGGGNLVFTEEGETYEGALDFGNDLSRSGPALQDPTIEDDEGEPARESNTTNGAWHPTSYSFSGTSFAYVDNTQNGAFSGCEEQNGQPDPDSDACVYDLPWEEPDAENGFRVEDDGTSAPYGVGLVSSVEVTGTTIVVYNDEPFLINDADAGDTTCLVILSGGLTEALPSHIDGETEWNEDVARQTFCTPGVDHVEVFEDAFSSTNRPGGFDAQVSWVKLTPTADATQSEIDSQDSLCTTGVFSTDQLIEGTGNNIELGLDDEGNEVDATYYTNCMSLESEYAGDAYDDETTHIHPLDGKEHSLPSFDDKSLDI